jgi:hypothetical protein
MKTVQEAIFAGLTEVSISCTTCRLLAVRTLVGLPGVLGNDLIANLHKRLVCRRCGNRPAAEDVKIDAPPTMMSSKYPDFSMPDGGARPDDPTITPATGQRRWKTRHRRMI